MQVTLRREVGTDDFARFLLRARVRLVPPLTAGSWARVELPEHEMLALSTARYEAPDDPVAQEVAFAVPVLAAPRRVLTAAWRHRQAVTAAYLVEADAGTVLLVDSGTTVRLQPVDPDRALRTLLDALPTWRPAPMGTVTASTTALRALTADHSTKGFGRRAQAAADAAAIDRETLAVLDAVERTKTGQGALLAVGYDHDVATPAPFTAEWTVGGPGAVLRSGPADGPMTFEAADDAAVFRAARTAFQGARAAVSRPRTSFVSGGLR